jgi:hypothetical protein
MSKNATVLANTDEADQTTALKLLDVVDDINTVRLLISAAHMAATSDDVPYDCGLATLLDVIEEKLTAARDKLEAASPQDKEPDDV